MCTAKLKVVSGSECKTNDSADGGTLICQIDQYTADINDNTCTDWPSTGNKIQLKTY